MKSPFKAPLRAEASLDCAVIVGADNETVGELWSHTSEELAELLHRVNAYDGLVKALQELCQTDGSADNVRDAPTLARRVRTVAQGALDAAAVLP